MSCGAGVRLSYMYWMTSILISGTWRCTLIDERQQHWRPEQYLSTPPQRPGNYTPATAKKQNRRLLLTCQLSVFEISHTHSCPSLHPETMYRWSVVIRILDIQCVGASRPQITSGTTKLLAISANSYGKQQACAWWFYVHVIIIRPFRHTFLRLFNYNYAQCYPNSKHRKFT